MIDFKQILRDAQDVRPRIYECDCGHRTLTYGNDFDGGDRFIEHGKDCDSHGKRAARFFDAIIQGLPPQPKKEEEPNP